MTKIDFDKIHIFTIEPSMPQNVNGSSSRHVLDANSGHKRAPEATQMSFQSHGRIFTTSHGTSSKDGLDNARKRAAILDG